MTIKPFLLFTLCFSFSLFLLSSCNQNDSKKENSSIANQENIDSSRFLNQTLYVKKLSNLVVNQKGKVLLFFNEKDSINISPLLVKKLRFYPNLLNKFPLEILKFKNLEYLWLGMQQFEVLPKEISTLKFLTCLDFQHSRLKFLPDEIGSLKNLKSLILLFTNLEKIPITIGNLKNLSYLHIGGTKIKQLPKSLSKLKKLKRLIYFSEEGDNLFKGQKEKLQKQLPNCKLLID